MEDLVNTLPFNIGIESLAGLVSSVWQWRLLLVGERGIKQHFLDTDIATDITLSSLQMEKKHFILPCLQSNYL